MTVVDASAKVIEILDDLGAESILLVTGGRSYHLSGAAIALEPALAQRIVTHISDVQPNPTLEAVEAAVESYRLTTPDVVIAVGGGSVLDLAKASRALAHHPGPIRSVIEAGGSDLQVQPDTPLIAIPTTAGSGSEATHFAVVYVDGTKHSVAHEVVRPTHSVIDPTLTASLPEHIVASTGLDALAQAIESFWSIRSTPVSTEYANEAMALAARNLKTAVIEPHDESRIAMSRAAHLAGKAIDITTTTAPHALSYTLTTRFGVPHGHAVGLTLGAVLEFNAGVEHSDCRDPRGPEYVRSQVDIVCSTLGADSPASARSAITGLMADIGLAPTLHAVGAGSSEAKGLIARSVNTQRLTGNPREFTTASLHELVQSID